MYRCRLLLIIFFMVGCKEEKHPVEAAFYYWKTNFTLTGPEKQILEELDVNKLYVRYFDIAMKNNTPVPVMPVFFESKPPVKEIVPVVYIKNEVMLNERADLPQLAAHVVDYIGQINRENNITTREIQLDCDWTLNSKDRFLAFVNLLAEKTKDTLSATIRLHQAKYHNRTGIPKVHKGVLMYYNMGTIAADSLNSIYDRNIAKRYLPSLKNYPLQLNVAVPLYAWMIHSRQNKILRLVSRIRLKDMEAQKAFKKIDDSRFIVLQSGNYFGHYFKKDDEVKIESISEKDLKEMVADLRKSLKQPPGEIIFYDLDSTNINAYEKTIFKKLVNSF